MSFCIICKKGGKLSNVLDKGQKTIIEASVQREDDIDKEILRLTSSNSSVLIHEKCRRDYSNNINIQKVIEENAAKLLPPPMCVTRRKISDPFDYPTHCIVCAKRADIDKYNRNPAFYQQVCKVELIDIKKKSMVQETILCACQQRGDDLAIQVRARIEFAQDLRAVEAVYHKQCVSTFTSPLSIKCAGTTGVNIRNLNLDNDLAFQELCNWLQDEENQIRQYTMAELRTEMSRYLPDGVPAYSVNHLKKKLQERFQDQLTVSGMEGKMNVVTFSRSVTAILHETYTDTNTCDFDERLESIKNIGKSIRQDIHTEQKSNESYPPPCDINIETLESQIPYYLLKLITCIIHGPPEKTEVNERNRLVIISICHLIMQAT